MKNRFEESKIEKMYGVKPCKRGHVGPNGKSVRTKHTGCWACECGLPDGPFTFDFGDLPQQEFRHRRKYATPEEAYAAHVARQAIWNKNNIDKFRAAQRRYSAKPEVIERKRTAYQNFSEEQREAVRERQRRYYQAHKEEISVRLKAERAAKRLNKETK